MSELFDGNSPSEFVIVREEPDSEGHAQALWVAVRPVWHGNEKSVTPVIQISYQEECLQSGLNGPVFLTPETWDKLVEAVEWRVKHHTRKRRRLWMIRNRKGS